MHLNLTFQSANFIKFLPGLTDLPKVIGKSHEFCKVFCNFYKLFGSPMNFVRLFMNFRNFAKFFLISAEFAASVNFIKVICESHKLHKVFGIFYELCKDVGKFYKLYEVVHKFYKFWGEWPSGLRCCIQNRKVSGSKPARCLAGLRDPNSLRGFW